MALEIETKLRVASHGPVRQRLRAIDALYLGRTLEDNEILDATDGSLRKNGCGLRIRKNQPEDGSEPRIILTFKAPVLPGTMKSRQEQEVAVADAEKAITILNSLGYESILSYQKCRESWRVDECSVELDEPPHIGLFVEIEGPSESAILRVQSRLELDSAEQVKSSYVRLLWDYCADHGIDDRKLTLAGSKS